MKNIGKIRKLMLHIIEEADMFLRNYPNIACFSESKDSPTMWAHYADNHKGFVLEYDFKNYKVTRGGGGTWAKAPGVALTVSVT